MFSTETPEYLLFLNNQAELNGVKHQLNSELDVNQEWTIYNNNSWEGSNGSTTKVNG